MSTEGRPSSVIATTAALLLAVFAATGLLRWLLPQSSSIQLLANYSAASPAIDLCFVLIGLALLLPVGRPRLRRNAQITSAGLVIIIAAAFACADITHLASGSGHKILHHWLVAGAFTPSSQMPLDAAVEFVASGLAILFLQLEKSRSARITCQALILIVLVMGVSGVFIKILNLNLLYDWYGAMRMTPATVGGFLATGVAPAGTWVSAHQGLTFYRRYESEKISLVGGTIMIAIAIATGVGTFALSQRKTEAVLAHELGLTLHSRVDFFAQMIKESETDARFIVTRPALISNLEKLEAHPYDRKAFAALQTAVHSFVDFDYDAATLYDSRHNVIAHAGMFVRSPSADVELSSPHAGHLLWHGEFLFRTFLPMKSAGRIIGYAELERPLPYLAKMFQDFRGLGSTTDMAVCSLFGHEMLCFPLRNESHAGIYQEANYPSSLPMKRALAGQTGVITTKDYRNKTVIAAYGPIDDLGLGMVLKIDTAELYDPIRKQLEHTIPLLLLLIVVGTFLLRWQVTPLVRRLIQSERESRNMRRALESVVDGVSQLDSHGRFLAVGGRYAGHLGYTTSELIGKDCSVIVHPDDRNAMRRGFEQMQREGRAEIEARALHKNGSQSYIQIFMVSNYDKQNDVVGRYCFMKDISERKHAEEVLQSMSFIDDLTGLQNRRGFFELAGEQLKLARRSNKDLLLFFLDIDDMKQINDEFGHREGDAALIGVAQVLRATFRGSDVIARLGGDEFAVITMDASADAESVISERMRANLDHYNASSGSAYRLGVSVGMVRSDPASDTSLSELLVKADQLMYRSKHTKLGRLKLK